MLPSCLAASILRLTCKTSATRTKGSNPHPTLTLTSANPSPNQVPRGRHPRAGFGRWLHVRAAPASNDKPELGVEPRPLSPAVATGPPHRHWGRAGGRGWPGAGGRLTWPRRAARGAGAGGCNFSEEIELETLRGVAAGEWCCVWAVSRCLRVWPAVLSTFDGDDPAPSVFDPLLAGSSRVSSRVIPPHLAQ